MFDPKAVTYSVLAEQDDLDVRGNALASGDDAEDRKVEDEILDRLNRGDVWAWAAVTVEATVEGIPFTGRDHLGACNYSSEHDFTSSGGYYDDMCAAALADLERQVVEALASGKRLADSFRQIVSPAVPKPLTQRALRYWAIDLMASWQQSASNLGGLVQDATWTPTPEAEWVQAGEFCISAGGMKGRVLKIIARASLPQVRVFWTNGHTGTISITQVRQLEKRQDANG